MLPNAFRALQKILRKPMLFGEVAFHHKKPLVGAAYFVGGGIEAP